MPIGMMHKDENWLKLCENSAPSFMPLSFTAAQWRIHLGAMAINISRNVRIVIIWSEVHLLAGWVAGGWHHPRPTLGHAAPLFVQCGTTLYFYFTYSRYLLERSEKDQNCKLQFPQPDYWPRHSPDFRTVFEIIIGPIFFCKIGKTWGTNKKVNKQTNKN